MFQIEIIGEDQKCVSISAEEFVESCRLCVRRKGTITIFERAEPHSERNFSDLLSSLYLVEVEKNDRLPQKICKYCATMVNEFYYFKNQINHAQIIMNVALGKVEVSDDSSTKITDEMTDLLCDEQFDMSDSDHVNEIEIETSDNVNNNYQIESTDIIEDVKMNIEPSNLDDTKNYTCHFCDRIFSDRKKLLNHRSGEYRRKKIKLFGKTMIPCSICQKSIVKGRIRDHLNTHSEARTHVCEMCGKSYRSLANLYGHKLIHKKTENCYVCHICGRTYHSYSSFLQHQRLHRLGKDVEFRKAFERGKSKRCDICQKEFKCPKHLEIHMRSHTGERPHECTECGKKFLQTNHLSDHMKLHTGEKPFECAHCDKRFTLKGNLKQHIRTHTKDKQHCCDICQKTFYTNSSLRKHKMIHDKKNNTVGKKVRNAVHH